jgi:hypothetical protein
MNTLSTLTWTRRQNCALPPQFGNTALHQAAWNGFSETIQVLCKHRANTSIKNKVSRLADIGAKRHDPERHDSRVPSGWLRPKRANSSNSNNKNDDDNNNNRYRNDDRSAFIMRQSRRNGNAARPGDATVLAPLADRIASSAVSPACRFRSSSAIAIATRVAAFGSSCSAEGGS